MPRTSRATVAFQHYHVLNRGNNRQSVFFEKADYENFVCLMRRACDRFPLRLYAACLMPNHFHIVAYPLENSAMARWVHWLGTKHAIAHHRRHGTSGHVWQSRYKAFPIQDDDHMLTVMRYVERNALRGGLVERAEDWPWGSLAWRASSSPIPLGAYELPSDWSDLVNEPQSQEELEALQQSVDRGAPFGDPTWQRERAKELGLEHTLNAIGRPKKK